MTRKSLTKKTRFDVFKRDSFKCQYCGSCPPSVILEVDHVQPISKGGGNNTDNLITACFDCNRGKSSGSLESIPDNLVIKAERIKEKEDQLKAYRKIIKAKKARLTRDVRGIEGIFQGIYDDSSFTEATRQVIKNQFLPKLDVGTLKDNMSIACDRITDNPLSAYKYFCGICWRMIKDNNCE